MRRLNRRMIHFQDCICGWSSAPCQLSDLQPQFLVGQKSLSVPRYYLAGDPEFLDLCDFRQCDHMLQQSQQNRYSPRKKSVAIDMM